MTARARQLRKLGFGWRKTLTGYAGQQPPEADAYLMPLVLDRPVPSCMVAEQGESLLTLPLGASLVADRLVEQLSRLGHAKVLVVRPATQPQPYEDRIDPDVLARIRVVAPDELTKVAAGYEASDYLFLVDPRYWPTAGYDFDYIAAQARRYQGATWAVALGGNDGDTREHVEYDPQGRIRRVQRLYSPMSWPATSSATIFCAVVPARAVCDVTFGSLSELRCRLIERGVLTQDLPILTDVDDLANEVGLLAWSHRQVEAMVGAPAPEGMSRPSRGVLIGEGCRIDPTARLVPPVLLQDYVTVGPEAMLVGPVVIGAGSQIGRRAVVAQSVVLPNTRLADEAIASNTMLAGPVAAVADLTEVPPDADTQAQARMLEADGPAIEAALLDLPQRHRVQQIAKRLLDIVLAGGGLLMLSPLLIVAGIIVKLTSPGPLFFIHRRECKGGRKFGCIKFRTMVPDAHARQRELYKQNQVDGPQFKMENDPRVTRIGRLLRATNLDELPQLLNVLAGQMSLVGPRPSPFRENQICVAWRRARLSVRPGITGLWQICRDRDHDADFHQWIFYDITYVKNFSLWLDIKILWRTILSGGGRRRVPLARLLDVEDPHVGSTADAKPADRK